MDAPDATVAAVAAARTAEIAARFGEQLSEEQLIEVKRAIIAAIGHSQRLRELPLANTDEPEIVFQPFRADGGRP